MISKQQTDLTQHKALTELLNGASGSFTEAADKLGIDRATVTKYFKQWSTSEEALEVKREWWTQYKYFKATKPEIAFEALTRVLLKMTKEQVEVSTVSDSTVNLVFDMIGPTEQKSVLVAESEKE